jgi:hypothetical protein
LQSCMQFTNEKGLASPVAPGKSADGPGSSTFRCSGICFWHRLEV